MASEYAVIRLAAAALVNASGNQIEHREYQNDSDVYYQPRPEVVPGNRMSIPTTTATSVSTYSTTAACLLCSTLFAGVEQDRRTVGTLRLAPIGGIRGDVRSCIPGADLPTAAAVTIPRGPQRSDFARVYGVERLRPAFNSAAATAEKSVYQ